ncbi:DUF6427 family protein [Flavobacterium sp.]|uniref:DUF6427 family protein n=1 Tax=Flavobacterium sp. TaxID=239 RepID=UPI00261AD465|nr:DUF6427 family protein [Flavobacterium sp.]
MITSVFKKSTPLNYSLVVILMLFFFLLYQFQDLAWFKSVLLIAQKVFIFLLLAGTLFINNFICKKNGLSKDSTYTVFFFFLYVLFFPSIFDNLKIVVANLFLLLALRRLLSLQSLKASKEKIFDASLWILLASMLEPWCILFMALVFISVLFHVSNDYRNWVLPFIALAVVVIGFMVYATFQAVTVEEFWLNKLYIDVTLTYFTNNYQNWAFAIFMTVALFMVIVMLLSYSSKPQVLLSSYKKLIAFFVIAMTVFFISPDKSNDLLLFVFAPLAIMGTNALEVFQQQLKQELILGVLIVSSLFTFFTQL